MQHQKGSSCMGKLRSLRTTFAVPAPTVETMPAALGMADDGASSEKKPKNRNGAEDPPANTVAPAQLPLNALTVQVLTACRCAGLRWQHS